MDITAKKAAKVVEAWSPTTHFEGSEDEGKDIHGQNVKKKKTHDKTEKILPLLDVP